MNQNSDIVWSSRLDNHYDVNVIRVGPYRGELLISENGDVLASHEVTIAYDAQFGPDVQDVITWCEIAEGFFDTRDLDGPDGPHNRPTI